MPSQESFSVEVKDIMGLMKNSIDQGMSTSKILEDLNLPLELLDKPSTLIDMDDCWRIIIANQNSIHEESHLMSSRPLKRGTTRLIFSNLYHCSNLLEGLQTLADTYNIVHGGNYNFVHKRGNTLSYVVDDSDFHYFEKPNIFAIEFALIKIHCALCFITGQALKLVRMSTKREFEPKHNHHLNLLNTKILYKQTQYELVYESDQTELPFNATSNIDIAGNIYAHYLSIVQHRQTDQYNHAFIQKVIHKIKQGSVVQGTRNQEAVASAIGMSVATLRRHLSEQNTSFRQLLDKVNCELAVNDLHEQILPADVAERLGYSDVRSFKRAFKRWYGVSPAAYVKSHQLLT